MADAVATQTLLDDARNLVMKFTNISDGTGEAAVTKVDLTTLTTQAGAPLSVKIVNIEASTFGMGVDILWHATANVLAWHVPTDMDVRQEFRRFGGLINNGGAGKTGNIKFTTINHTSGDRYSIILEMVKKY
jgi:PHP family Zn ribbon phosphoesterase